MSSFSKKFKRKEQIKTNKKVAKVKANIEKVKREAKRIFTINEARIDELSHCRVLPALAYAIRRLFKWGATRLVELSEKIIKFVEDYFTAGMRNGHVYITDEWLRDGLVEECNYTFPKYKRVVTPEDATKVGSWVAMYAGNHSIFVLECLETVCMWILHTDYGFGGSRLKKLGEEMRKIRPLDMPMKMLYHMMDDVESAKGKTSEDKLVFAELRAVLKRLDIQHNDFDGGLIMLDGKAC